MTMFAGPSAASSALLPNWPINSDVVKASSGSANTMDEMGIEKTSMRPSILYTEGLGSGGVDVDGVEEVEGEA